MKELKVALCLAIASLMLFTSVAFAEKKASSNSNVDEFGNKVTESKVKISDKVESSLPNPTVIKEPADPSNPTGEVRPSDWDWPWNSHTHSITNVNKTQYNLYNALTDYLRNNYQQGTSLPTVSWAAGRQTTVSASLTFGAGCDTELVKLNTTSTIGVSTTYTATTTYTFPVPYGQAGRVIFRYSQDYYTFTCNKIYSNGSVTSSPGNGWSSAYNTYYALQTYNLW